MRDYTRPHLDVFNIAVLEGATFVGAYDIPLLKVSSHVPLDVIAFSRRKHANESHCLHFFEDDREFYCLRRDPVSYLPLFHSVGSVITPDFSMSPDMPLWMQIEAVGMNRTVGRWLQTNGVEVIPNARWCDKRSLSFAFDGIPECGTVAVGSHGAVKGREVRPDFLNGFYEMIERVHPKTIVVYGTVPPEMRAAADKANAHISQHRTQTDIAHSKRKV